MPRRPRLRKATPAPKPRPDPLADVPVPPGYEGRDRFTIYPGDISPIVLVDEDGKPAPADWYPPDHPQAAPATDPTKPTHKV